MHELAIANSILEAVRTELTRHPGRYATRVGVRIGELTAVDQESLRFCFEAIILETDFDCLKLEIELVPRRQTCLACRCVFRVRDYEFGCPQCASLQTEFSSGDELELAYLEVEEYGASPVATKGTD
ncbi:MAG TPA: hydrogenase maturation nickel metallochaperone HypA [Terriglobales bacterium]|nr:hydrogenase maturation nickel metallochaperone HypA [Terriglobales bacterium]